MKAADWTTSSFSINELRNKKVEFTLGPPENVVTPRMGFFRVGKHADGRLAIEIELPTWSRTGGRVDFYPLSQIRVDQIRRHPAPERADFQLIAPE